MQWVDKALPSDVVLLNAHMSMALSSLALISSGWIEYVDVMAQESKIYLDKIKKKYHMF